MAMNTTSLHQDPFLLPLVPRDRGQSLGQSLPTISLLLMPAVNRQGKGIIEWALMGLYWAGCLTRTVPNSACVHP